MWRPRKLSLKGKITMLWSIALPQLLYACSTLYTPEWVIKEADTLFFTFLWSSKKLHVKKRAIIADIRNGGLRMIHFENMLKAVKINWIKRFIMNDSNHNILAAELSGFLLPLKDVVQLNLNERNIKCKDPFYQQVFEIGSQYTTNILIMPVMRTTN